MSVKNCHWKSSQKRKEIRLTWTQQFGKPFTSKTSLGVRSCVYGKDGLTPLDRYTFANMADIRKKQRRHVMKPQRIRFSHGEMQTRIIPETVLNQLRSHLSAFPGDLRRMVVLLLESGIRVRELCCLSYDCLELHADGHQFLRYLDRKIERERSIPLSPLAVEVIVEQQ